MSGQLKQKYKNEVVAPLKEKLELDNVMMVPKIEKVVLNIGLGEALDNAKAIEFLNKPSGLKGKG